MNKNEDILFSKLIEETCTESTNKDHESDHRNNGFDLNSYFEKRLNEVDFLSITDYLSQQQLTHQSLSLEPNSQCFRLQINESILDFPSNWSIFKEIRKTNMIYVDQSLDEDFLLDILAEMRGCSDNLLLVKERDEVQLIFLSEETSHDHVEWVRNYFEKKNVGSREKAAA